MKRFGIRTSLVVTMALLLSVVAPIGTGTTSANKANKKAKVAATKTINQPKQQAKKQNNKAKAAQVATTYVGGPTTFVSYNQNDAANGRYVWGSRIASTGCGPTSAAMVVSSLTANHMNPIEMANFLSPQYYIPGSGTTPGAFAYIGQRFPNLKVQHAGSYAAVTQSLRSGGLAIVHARPGHFTGAGHYMVIRYVSPSGNQYTLADPNGAPGRDSETRTWTGAQLQANGIDDIWTFTPRG